MFLFLFLGFRHDRCELPEAMNDFIQFHKNGTCSRPLRNRMLFLSDAVVDAIEFGVCRKAFFRAFAGVHDGGVVAS